MSSEEEMTKTEFQNLFEQLYSPLCNYAFAIVKDHDEAEDIVQGVLVDFWNKGDHSAIDVEYERYLIRAVKFKSIDVLRKLKVRQKHEAEIIHLHNHPTEEEAEKNYELLHMAISELPEKTREVFTLSKLDGKSYKEIADQLGISVKTVENQMGRAFRHLREKLCKYKELLILLIFLQGE